jgi:hypothetical protein
MIDAPAIDEILKIYIKHGWSLRRVLLSSAAAGAANSFGDADIRESNIDALWFSRASRAGGEAWELRALTPTPLALLEVIPVETNEPERESILNEVEGRLREMLIRGRAKNN